MNEIKYKLSGTIHMKGTTAMSWHKWFVVARSSIDASAGNATQANMLLPLATSVGSAVRTIVAGSTFALVGSSVPVRTADPTESSSINRLTCQPNKPASSAKPTNTPLHIQPCDETPSAGSN